jgi:hypothetical protein
MNSKTLHSGAIFAMSMHGKWLYTGGWDKNVNIQVEMNVVKSAFYVNHLILCYVFGNYTDMNLVKSAFYVNHLNL